jgi:hypothetical protein
MPSHEKEVENEHCQTKGILVWSPNNLVEAFTLQFWRGEFLFADLAKKRLASDSHLKGVTVD